MAKINPFAYRTAARQTETKTFTDPEHPDAPLTLTLAPARDITVNWAINERAEDLYAKYTTGGGFFSPSPNGTATISKTLFTAIASLMALEAPEGGDAPYTVEEWAALSVAFPRAFLEASAWATELAVRYLTGSEDDPEAALKNDLAAL